MTSRKIAILAVIGGALLGSAVAGVSKKGLEEITPFSFTFIRFLIASLCVLPFFVHKKGHKISGIRNTVVPISLFATMNVVFFTFGVHLTKANVGSVIYAAVPLLTGLILFLFFKERLSFKKQLGILLGFIGVAFITLLPVFEKSNPFSGNILGNILLVISITSWSFYMVYSSKLQQQYSPFIITCYFIFISTAVLFPFFLWDLVNNFGWWNHVGFWGIFSLFYVGVMITVVSYLLNQYAIKHGGSVLAGTMFYILPVFAFVINFFLLGEQLTSGFIWGSILALVGTYLVVRK